MTTTPSGEGFTEGPWMVFITRPRDLGHTVYHVATHTHTAVALGREFWAPEDVPEGDANGYHQPDERCDLADHRLANARLIASSPDLYAACKAMVSHLDAMTNAPDQVASLLLAEALPPKIEAARAALTLATQGAKAAGGGE